MHHNAAAPQLHPHPRLSAASVVSLARTDAGLVGGAVDRDELEHAEVHVGGRRLGVAEVADEQIPFAGLQVDEQLAGRRDAGLGREDAAGLVAQRAPGTVGAIEPEDVLEVGSRLQAYDDNLVRDLAAVGEPERGGASRQTVWGGEGILIRLHDDGVGGLRGRTRGSRKRRAGDTKCERVSWCHTWR
jgi:hypothetical protein